MSIRKILPLLLSIIVLTISVLFVFLWPEKKIDDPWAKVAKKTEHTNHSELLKGPFKDGPSVTKACLQCHEESAHQVMKTVHWTWEGEPVTLPNRQNPVRLGKKNAINNFCIGIRSNWPPCTACHAGYGWEDEKFDFTQEYNVDCLVCHEHSGTYVKSLGGLPAKDVDLEKVAQSVGLPTRENCGSCHFRGGGGNAVKHGDLDGSLYHPTDRIDVHMGKHGFVCTDCHTTIDHQIKGRAISVSYEDKNQVYCTNCHDGQLHKDQRINAHVATVACQTCHIPEGAVKEATKMHWDWSTAGQDLPQDPHKYLKIKGSFVYESNFQPSYFWYDGKADHYLFGDKMDPKETTLLNDPQGDIRDPKAKIWPFKVHTGKQIYDKKYEYFLQPKTFGKDGFWTEFDWDKAAKLGSETTGQKYSGEFGFAPTVMFWPLTHMVAPKEKALQCVDCHGDSKATRMDWKALGYDGDPMYTGGRKL